MRPHGRYVVEYVPLLQSHHLCSTQNLAPLYDDPALFNAHIHEYVSIKFVPSRLRNSAYIRICLHNIQMYRSRALKQEIDMFLLTCFISCPDNAWPPSSQMLLQCHQNCCPSRRCPTKWHRRVNAQTKTSTYTNTWQ